MVLETDDAVSIGHKIFLAKLNTSVRLFAGFRMAQAFRLHRAKSQGFRPAAGYLLYRQARFEPVSVFKTFERDGFRSQHFGDERLVLLPVHRTINIIVATLVISRRLE